MPNSGLRRPDRPQSKNKSKQKRNKCLDLASELKKLWNMKVTVISIVTGELQTILKGVIKGLENLEVRGQVETFLITRLLRSARILRRVLETSGDLSPKLQ